MSNRLGGVGKRGEANGIASAVDHLLLRPTVQNTTTITRAPIANRWPRFHAMGSFNHFDQHFSEDFHSQDFLNAPTPDEFGRTDSPPSMDIRSTTSPVPYEVPRTSTPSLRPRPHTKKLAFLQLSEWYPAKVYDDEPPTYLRVTIGWKATLNGKPFYENTEPNVVLTLASY